MMELCADTVMFMRLWLSLVSVPIRLVWKSKMTFLRSWQSLLLIMIIWKRFENREQIEISRYYEKLPKPTLIATQEYIEGKIYYRNPAKEKEKLQ